ncbi:MAG: DnaJ domain-containing protein [Synergistaceae bacterium]|nr:DnaJ domain-containing protein [Synergistaceae bacterium]
MNANDNFYRALGLQPGASPDEIRAAYRRLAKLYHPDKDPSLDGEMRYREIRMAYDALRQKRGLSSKPPRPPRPPRPTEPPRYQNRARQGMNPNEAFTNAHKSHGASGGKGWWYVEEDDAFDFSDLMWEYGGRKAPKKRAPFVREALPRILWESFKEAATLGMGIRAAISFWGLWSIFGMIELSPLFGVVVIFCSSIGFLFFRYYADSPPQDPAMHMLGSVLYSLGLGFLCSMSAHRMAIMVTVRDNFGIPRKEIAMAGDGTVFFLVVLMTFFSLLPLWAHPLIWLENAIQGGKSSWPR